MSYLVVFVFDDTIQVPTDEKQCEIVVPDLVLDKMKSNDFLLFDHYTFVDDEIDNGSDFSQELYRGYKTVLEIRLDIVPQRLKNDTDALYKRCIDDIEQGRVYLNRVYTDSITLIGFDPVPIDNSSMDDFDEYTSRLI